MTSRPVEEVTRCHDGQEDTQLRPATPRRLARRAPTPKDHFYRRLEARLDLSFVRELVAPLYANGGRPSVDPVVFFKLQLVMFFEDFSE
jgi:transposase